MDLTELKSMLRVDGDDLDVVVGNYQLAAEAYLLNAGVTKDYDNGLYKVAVVTFCTILLDNPSLLTEKRSSEVTSVTLNAMITQLRLAQQVAAEQQETTP